MIKDVEAQFNLIPKAIELIKSENELQKLSENILKLADKNSDERIVDEICKLIK